MNSERYSEWYNVTNRSQRSEDSNWDDQGDFRSFDRQGTESDMHLSFDAEPAWQLPDDDPALLGTNGTGRAWYGEDWSWESVTPVEPVVFDDGATATADAEQEDAAEEPLRWGALLREVAETLILTALIFVLVRGLLVQNFRIEGSSMEPNLHEGQYLIVNKLVYHLQQPERGDIVVFAFPRGPERDFIKRVLGVPGDVVEVRPGQVLVNGEPIDESSYAPGSPNYSAGPVKLGPNEYFVLGDNRNNSSDSHSWGPLDRKYIIGKAWLSYWPPDEWGLVPNFPVQAREAATPATTP